MTRIDSVRDAADRTKDTVRHAAVAAAPYAGAARDSAVLYGKQAGVYGRQAGLMARREYDVRLAPKVAQARDQAMAAMPPKAAAAVETASRRTRKGARVAAAYTVPRAVAAVATTRAVAGPAREEVVLRGAAALQALRGNVTAADIDRLVRRRLRRQRAGRAARGVLVIALAGGALYAAYQWWSKQTDPDWLVEPSEPTEVGDRIGPGSTLTVVDTMDDGGSLNGAGPSVDRVDGSPEQDPEVEAKQAEADRHDDDEQ